MAINKRLLLEWGNDCDIGNTMYQTGFKNQVYFDSLIGLPQTKTVTEGTQNGEQKLIPSFQKRSKQYEFSVLVPEYMVDALGDVRLHNNIRLTQFDPDVVYNITDRISFNISGNYEFEGCLAHLTITFEADEVVVKTGCCDDLGLPPCVSAEITATGAGDELPDLPAIGAYFLFGGPKTGAPGYFDFTLYFWNGLKWATVTVPYGTYILADGVYYYFQTTVIAGETVDVYAPLFTVLTVEDIDATTVKLRIKMPKGSWNLVELAADCSTYTPIGDAADQEFWAEELELTGVTIPGVTECGSYCVKVTPRKTGCDYEPVIFTLFKTPNPLVIDWYVDRVYLANLCPVPVYSPFVPLKIYLILPELPCTNVSDICDHFDELITRNPLDGTLLYIPPTPCLTIYDKATGKVWVYNDAIPQWEMVI